MRRREPPPPIPTLAELQRIHNWWWLVCHGCQRFQATALAPLVIRWGSDASSDKLRRNARCTACGHRGAALQHPSWAGAHIGFVPFPADR
jgi:hypothetical protein